MKFCEGSLVLTLNRVMCLAEVCGDVYCWENVNFCVMSKVNENSAPTNYFILQEVQG